MNGHLALLCIDWNVHHGPLMEFGSLKLSNLEAETIIDGVGFHLIVDTQKGLGRLSTDQMQSLVQNVLRTVNS
jgi:hypothetical protein